MGCSMSCLIEAMPTMEFLALLRHVSSGNHLDDPRVTYVQTAEIELALRTPRSRLNTDGQVLEAAHCTYRVLAARGDVSRGPHERARAPRISLSIIRT